MARSDFVARSIGQVRGRLLGRAASEFGTSSANPELAERAAIALGVWAASASLEARVLGTWRWRLRSAALDWFNSTCTFEETRGRMADALASAEVEETTTRELLAVRTLIGTLGFFSLTESLLTRAIERAIRDFGCSRNRWSARNAFTAHIVRGELDLALETLEYWQRVSGPRDPEIVATFFELCRVDEVRDIPDTAVNIIGPGPIGELGHEFNLNRPVCRVVMPGVTTWPNDDIANGRADFAYLNGDSTEWLSSLSRSDRDRLLNSFRAVRIKKETDWEQDYQNVAQVRRIKDLFFSGEPNMVPTIIMDQLVSGSSKVYVAGTTFFVGAEPYRLTDRRHFHKINTGSDRFGAVRQGSFERCYSHASHDQIINRAVVRRLFDAGKVMGDESFERALLMSDSEYLNELEQTYGVHRR